MVSGTGTISMPATSQAFWYRGIYICLVKYLFFIPILLLLAGCEKTINLQPANQPSLFVVDGSIEKGEAPLVVLSKSVNYFSHISADVLAASLVSDAVVTLSDGAVTIPLKRYEVRYGNYSFYYFSNDTTNPASNLLGEEGKTYTLNIAYNNQTYTAVTSIPHLTKTVDSIWWKQAPHTDDTTKAVLMGQFTDPPGFGNYIRYWTKVNSDRFLPGVNSVFDDQVTDGETYSFQIDQGIDRNNPPEGEDYGYFHRGDTVTLKFANIDKVTFDFWRTLEFSYQTTNNPFSTPTKVLSNVSNGALGAFCGYNSMYRSVIIPK